MTNKAAGGSTTGKLPESKSLVPGGGESVSTVGGDNLGQWLAAWPEDPKAAQSSTSTIKNLHSQRRYGNDHVGIALGSRRRSRRGSSSR